MWSLVCVGLTSRKSSFSSDSSSSSGVGLSALTRYIRRVVVIVCWNIGSIGGSPFLAAGCVLTTPLSCLIVLIFVQATCEAERSADIGQRGDWSGRGMFR
eukprot:739078-Pyramimonas_sp.AAC.1